jgi:hypothetical protein
MNLETFLLDAVVVASQPHTTHPLHNSITESTIRDYLTLSWQRAAELALPPLIVVSILLVGVRHRQRPDHTPDTTALRIDRNR